MIRNQAHALIDALFDRATTPKDSQAMGHLKQASREVLLSVRSLIDAALAEEKQEEAEKRTTHIPLDEE